MARQDRTWLVAGWPSMGHVGVLAVAQLRKQLRPDRLAELSVEEFFELSEVRAREGGHREPRGPRVTLDRWNNPEGQDLLLLSAEALPLSRAPALCDSLVRRARRLNARCVATFAGLPCSVPPRAPSRVYALATDAALLQELRQLEGLRALGGGAVGGLNGVLLTAARSAGIPGLCFLGGIPSLATAVPQPKASAAVLRCFGALLGIPLDMTELDTQAELMETRLTTAQDDVAAPGPVALAAIEALFLETSRDRSRALELKTLLEVYGLFEAYQDRFLDLFKREG